MSRYRLPRWLEILGGLVILLELVAPFVSNSYGTDGPSQAYLAEAFSRLFVEGVLSPKWLPGGFNGHGSPTFYFYPPLAFYVAGIVRLITSISDPDVLFHTVGLIATLASVLTARVLLREFSASRYQLWLGSLIYAFGPYRIAELYSRSSLSSHVAYVILPLVWYGILRVVRADTASSRRSVLVLAFAASALVLTSVPLALLTGLSALMAAIVWRRELRSTQVWLGLLLAGVIEAGLSAFHFVRVIEYRPYVHLNTLMQEPRYLLIDIFRLQGLSIAYHAAILYACAAFVLWIYWKHSSDLSGRERAVARTLLAIVPLLIFLETPVISLPVWRHVTIVNLIQAVWRFYIELLLVASCAVAVASSQRMRRAATLVTSLLVVGALLPAFLAATDHHLGPHYDAASSDPAEYLPATVRDSAVANGIHVMTVDPALNPSEWVRVTAPNPVNYRIESEFERPHIVHLARFYWPQWHAIASGSEITLRADSLGLTQLQIPLGPHTVSMELVPSELEVLGGWVSIIALVFAGLLYAVDVFQRRMSPVPSYTQPR